MSSVDSKDYAKGKKVAEAVAAPVEEDEMALVSVVVTAFKSAGVAIAVWCWGYLGFSFAWLYVALFFHVASEELRKMKGAKKAYTLQAMCSEKDAIMKRVDQTSSWIYFPDVEKAEWMNKMIKQMWPPIAEYTRNLLLTTIQESIQNNLPSNLNNFKFETVDIGDMPPRIDGVKVYTDSVSKDEITCDIELRYAGDANIKVTVKGVTAGIKCLKVTGNLRVVMILVDDVPIIGGLSLFFLNKPIFDFDLTAAANILDMPMLKNSIHGIVDNLISSYLVLPRRIPVQMHDSVEISRLKYPLPQGVIILHIVEAKDLKIADTNILGKNSSDPYCKMTVGVQMMKTNVIKKSLNPVWNKYFEAIVNQKHGQFVDVQVFDEDIVDEDDTLGFTNVDIERTARKGSVDLWLPLEDVKTGKIHIRAMWMKMSANLDDLRQKNAKNTLSSVRGMFPTAVLVVTVDNAKNLPISDKTSKERSPFVKLILGDKEEKTNVKSATGNPIWDENFQFLVYDPESEKITIEVWHHGSSDRKMDDISFSIHFLLSADNMSRVQSFTLAKCGSDCTLTVRFCMRLLKSDAPADWGELSGPAAASFSDAMRQSFRMAEKTSSDTKVIDSKAKNAVDDNKSSQPKDSHVELASFAPKEPVHRDDSSASVKQISKDAEVKQKSRETTPVEGKPKSKEGTPEDVKQKSRETTPVEVKPAPREATPVEEKPKPRETTPAREVIPPPKSRETTPVKVEEPKPKPREKTPVVEPEKTITRESTPPVAVKPVKEVVSIVPAPQPPKPASKFGQIQMTIRFSSTRSHLIVVIHQCKNLIPCDKDNLADPYIRMYLLPDRSAESKRRTKMIKNTLNPVFDETFEWPLGQMEIPMRSLDIAVKNDTGYFSKSRVDMGSILVDLSKVMDITQATTHWLDLCDPKST